MSATRPIEESLLDLYRSEADAQLAAMAKELPELSADSGSKKVQTAIASIRSLKGAARLVGLDKVAQLTQAMEQALSTSLEQKRALDSDFVDVLIRSASWLALYSQLPLEELANPSEQIMADQAGCITALSEPAKETKELRDPKGKKANEETPVVESPPAPTFSKPEAPATSTPPPPASRLDFSLLDLYRVEAETQLASLVKGLVELESDLANPKKIEPVMRAAHSLKGAARIIGLDLVSQLTHSMEDSLVAAQKGQLALNAAGIDAFLRTADWLAQFSKLPQEQLAAPSATQLESQAKCFVDVQAVLEGTIAAASAAPEVKSENAAPSPPSVSSESKTENRKPETSSANEGVVRVSAASLSRLMGLAAETLVEARRLQPFRDNLLKLKQSQLQFVSKLEAATSARAETGAVPVQSLAQLREAAQTTLDSLRAQVESFDNVARRSALLSGRLYQEVIASRMRPFVDGTATFPRLVRDVCRTLGKQARLEIEGQQTPVDRDILEKLEAPLSHLLRNACDHGLEAPAQRHAAGKSEVGVIRLEAHHRAGQLVVQVSDDGHGIPLLRLRRKIVEKGLATEALAKGLSDDELLQFLFLPGFSTAEKITEISGRGVGLDVVQSLVQEVGGSVRIFTAEGKGTMFTLNLPVTRSVLRALLTQVDGEAYAFPLMRMHRALRVPRSSVITVDGRPQILVEDLEAKLVCARAAFGLPGERKSSGDELAVVVLGQGLNLYALEVDRILGETDLVVRPLDARLGKVPGISAAALGEDGEPILIAEVDDLLTAFEKLEVGATLAPVRLEKSAGRKRILIVDDSPTVRATEQRILSDAGYEVETAVDGADGWNAVRLGRFDLVVSDVDMPRMNGHEFVALIRADVRLKSLPVVMVSYKDRDEDRERGLAAGANIYLTKSSFQDDTFLQAVAQLISPTL